MGRSLGMSAYRVLSRRTPHAEPDTMPPRPDGEVLWAHATSDMRYWALCDLAARLAGLRPGLHVIITYDQTNPSGMTGAMLRKGCDVLIPLHSDHPEAARALLAHWAPDFCLWTGGHLMPNLIGIAAEAGVPMVLADVGTTDFPTRRHKWFPDLTRNSLACFESILTNSDDAVHALRRIGVDPSQVRAASRLRSSAAPPFCSDLNLANLSQDLVGRPVWLAAFAQPDEFADILTAHRIAVRLLHRLLLIVAVADPGSVPALRQKLIDARLRFVDWDADGSLEDATQVVISSSAEDLGLWYRLAPLTLMANSLGADSTGANPMDAAALGSAVVYGPNVSAFLDIYSRLAAAGAARAVSDGEGLGSTLVQLIAPDRAAAMALAGWEVATEGADLTDHLIDLIQTHLDARKAGHASA